MPIVKAYGDPFKERGMLERVWDAITGKQDAWMNTMTGAGDPTRDKTTFGFMSPFAELGYGELEALYYGDDICERIVDELPDEAFRRGYELEGPLAADLTKQSEALNLPGKVRDAFSWSRLWGGSGIVVGADDGQTIDKPLNIEAVKSVKFLNVVDRRYLTPVTYYDDINSPKYGEPMTYQFTPAFGVVALPGGSSTIVHESRLVRFWGTRIDPTTRRRVNGWSYSVLQRPYEIIRIFAGSFQAASQLMLDAGQGVFKVTRLIQQMAGPNRAAILQRFAELDMQRWAGRMMLVDKDGEDFRREPVQVAGVSDLLEHFEMRMAAAARMPVTLLMGRSPAGENATGESDMRNWYASVKAKQKDVLEPAIKRLLNILSANKWETTEGSEIEWCGLEEPDDAAEAQVEKIEADTWKVYSEMGAVTGEQVALIKLAGKPIEEVLDVDALEAIVKSDYELAKNPPPPPPAGTLPPAPNGGSNGSNGRSQPQAPIGQAVPGSNGS